MQIEEKALNHCSLILNLLNVHKSSSTPGIIACQVYFYVVTVIISSLHLYTAAKSRKRNYDIRAQVFVYKLSHTEVWSWRVLSWGSSQKHCGQATTTVFCHMQWCLVLPPRCLSSEQMLSFMCLQTQAFLRAALLITCIHLWYAYSLSARKK